MDGLIPREWHVGIATKFDDFAPLLFTQDGHVSHPILSVDEAGQDLLEATKEIVRQVGPHAAWVRDHLQAQPWPTVSVDYQREARLAAEPEAPAAPCFPALGQSGIQGSGFEGDQARKLHGHELTTDPPTHIGQRNVLVWPHPYPVGPQLAEPRYHSPVRTNVDDHGDGVDQQPDRVTEFLLSNTATGLGGRKEHRIVPAELAQDDGPCPLEQRIQGDTVGRCESPESGA